jgi:hypothetical protein
MLCGPVGKCICRVVVGTWEIVRVCEGAVRLPWRAQEVSVWC